MNNVELIGRLTKDPKIGVTKKGTKVADFTLAVKRKYQKQENTNADFIPVVAYGTLADFAEKYFCKGQQIAVDGKINTNNYTDRNNYKHTSIEVCANNFYFADGFKEKNSNQTEPIKVEDKENEKNDLPF